MASPAEPTRVRLGMRSGSNRRALSDVSRKLGCCVVAFGVARLSDDNLVEGRIASLRKLPA
jgi:hypothetical protein